MILDVVEELRLFLRPVEEGIEARWITPDQGEPFVFANPISSDEAKTHRWYLEDFPRFPGVGDIARARGFEKRLIGWGEQLFAAIRSGDGGQQLQDLVNQRRPGLLTLVSEHPAPLALPWELLGDRLSLFSSRGLVIRRQLPGAPRRVKHRIGLPLRVLLVVPRPTDVGFIDPHLSSAA